MLQTYRSSCRVAKESAKESCKMGCIGGKSSDLVVPMLRGLFTFGGNAMTVFTGYSCEQFCSPTWNKCIDSMLLPFGCAYLYILYNYTSSTRTSRGRKFPVYKKNINL